MASFTMKDYQVRIPKKQTTKEPYPETGSTSVLTNMFKIKFKNNYLTKAVHYDVDITTNPIEQSKNSSTVSNKFSKALCRKIFEKCRDKKFYERYPAFDGKKNAYSASDLFSGNAVSNM